MYKKYKNVFIITYLLSSIVLTYKVYHPQNKYSRAPKIFEK